MRTKTGTEVVFTAPIKKTYQVETEDTGFAVGIAFDTIKRRYPTDDLSKAEYTTREYKYSDF